MKLGGTGGMLAVSLPADRIDLARWDGRLWPAVYSGPASTVVAGDLDALAEYAAECGEAVRTRPVAIDYAAHTPHIAALREELLATLGDVTPRPTEVAFCSARDGAFIDPAELTADYWFTSLRTPVRFQQAVEAFEGAPALHRGQPASDADRARPGHPGGGGPAGRGHRHPPARSGRSRAVPRRRSPTRTRWAPRSTGPPRSPAGRATTSTCPPIRSSAAVTGSTATPRRAWAPRGTPARRGRGAGRRRRTPAQRTAVARVACPGWATTSSTARRSCPARRSWSSRWPPRGRRGLRGGRGADAGGAAAAAGRVVGRGPGRGRTAPTSGGGAGSRFTPVRPETPRTRGPGTRRARSRCRPRCRRRWVGLVARHARGRPPTPTSGWPSTATSTAPPSRACAPPGVPARTPMWRSRCPSRCAGRGSPSIRRCWTRLSISWCWSPPMRRATPARCCCPSPGPGYGCPPRARTRSGRTCRATP